MREVLGGCDDITFNGVGTAAESGNHLGLFVHGNPEDICSSLHPSHDPTKVALASITAERLRSLCQGMRLPGLLEDASSDRARNSMASKKLSAAQRRLFSEIVSNPYSGPLSNLYCEGKMLGIVASVFSDLIGEEETPKALLGHEQSKFKMACDRILSDLASVPTQETLAREVGLPTRRLGDLFREVTGTTMTDWVLQNKLAMAEKLLLEGDLAVKQIATHLGYAHVSNFFSAFRTQHGCPPATYRKSPDCDRLFQEGLMPSPRERFTGLPERLSANHTREHKERRRRSS